MFGRRSRNIWAARLPLQTATCAEVTVRISQTRQIISCRTSLSAKRHNTLQLIQDRFSHECPIWRKAMILCLAQLYHILDTGVLWVGMCVQGTTWWNRSRSACCQLRSVRTLRKRTPTLSCKARTNLDGDTGHMSRAETGQTLSVCNILSITISSEGEL